MAADDVRRVFVYGSLLWERSLMRTLAHRSSPPAGARHDLLGWERSWNVVSARTFAPVRDRAAPRHRRIVLGVRPGRSAACEGVVLELTREDVAALAPREAAYVLTAVDADAAGTIHSFVPRPDRLLGAAPVIEPLAVEQAYLGLCVRGARAWHLDAAAKELKDSVGDLPIIAAGIER